MKKKGLLKIVALGSVACLCTAVCATGVIAALNHSWQINTSITFDSIGVNGTIKGATSGFTSNTFYNPATENGTTNSASASSGFAFAISDSVTLPAWAMGNLTLQSSGTTSLSASVSFTVTNTGVTTMGFGISGLNTLINSNLNLTYSVTNSASGNIAETSLTPQVYFEIASGSANTVFTINISVKDTAKKVDLTFSGIKIDLANAEDTNAWKTLALQDGEDSLGTITVFKDRTIVLPTVSKSGYTFDGWFEESTLTNSLTTVSDETVTYAKFTPTENSTYSITYMLDGGTNSSSNPATYTSSSDTITLKDPMRANYAFVGWYTSPFLTGTAVTEIPTNSVGNKVLYAKWMVAGLYTDSTYSTLTASWATLTDSANGYCSTNPVTNNSDGTITIQGTSASSSHTYFNTTNLAGALVLPSNVKTIGPYAFLQCSGLTSITIGSGVTSIGNYAFWYCSGLTGTLTIPSSVTSIGVQAFPGCTGLTGALTIPNGVTSIGDDAFFGCSGLTSVTIPSSVTNMGDSPFERCSGLTSIIIDSENTIYDSRDNCNAIILTSTNTLIKGCKNTTIPSSVTSIGEFAFYYSGLTGNITIPVGVTSIESHAFGGCTGLTSATIPDGVTSIGECAFYNTRLTSITIPSSVTSIGKDAFYYTLYSLVTINFTGNVSQWQAVQKGSSWNLTVSSTTVVKCSDGLAQMGGTALNVVINGEVDVTYYSVSSTTYTVKFKAKSGYTLPESVTASSGTVAWSVADSVGTLTLTAPTTPSADTPLTITVTATAD